MKPQIDHTEFGQINIDGKAYEYDVLIKPDGSVTKRKKKLSKKVYGTSHTLSVDEAIYIYDDTADKLIIGNGQYGVLELSPAAVEFFKEKGIEVVIEKTPVSANIWNTTQGNLIGLFHVTC
jgi:hypothetical protein